MNDLLYTFILGLALGFVIAWVAALKFMLFFKKQEVEK